MPEKVLVIACGALVREITALKTRYGWRHMTLVGIDARLHNRPADIPARLRAAIGKHGPGHDRLFVAYADCGTAGGIDRVIEEAGAERLPGAHCYEFLAGTARFERLANEEPGTFYLTDFLARHFRRLVIEPLGLDRHPELKAEYFGHYRRLVYLSQRTDVALVAAAEAAAATLGLEFVHSPSGYGELESVLIEKVGHGQGPENAHLLA